MTGASIKTADPADEFENRILAALQDSKPETAIFFAEKLKECQGRKDASDLLIARAFIAGKAYHRFLAEFKDKKSVHPQITVMHARALFEANMIPECQAFLDDINPLTSNVSELSLVQAKIHDKNQNVQLATEWYQRALKLDTFCVEAAQRLVGSGLVKESEEQDIVVAMNNINDPLIAARRAFASNDFHTCLSLTQSFADYNDELSLQFAPLYAATLLALKKTGDLFYFAHRIIQKFPSRSESWFAAGCYYLALEKLDSARKFFCKATTCQPQFCAAWLAYGHSFALGDESDHALVVYKTAHRLFPKSVYPLIHSARECLRTNAISLSDKYLATAESLVPSHPEVLGEMGSCAYANRQYAQAVQFFGRALNALGYKNDAEDSFKGESLLQCRRDERIPLFLSNLGYTYLKLRDINNAIRVFNKASYATDKNAVSLLGLAYCYQLLDDTSKAIDAYNRSLRCKNEGTSVMAKTLLSLAIVENAASIEKRDAMSVC